MLFEINNKGKDHAEVLIYAEIGESFWGEETVAAKDFVKKLQDIKAKQLDVRINSPGGSVFDGNSIYNALKRHPANVTTYIDGSALSIASIIALAGDEVVAAPNSIMMIHDPSGWVQGTASEMRSYAELLDKTKSGLVNTYKEKTGKDEKAIATAMAETTWFDAEEAVAWGLADRVGESVDEVANLGQFDIRALERFGPVPDRIVARFNALKSSAGSQPAVPNNTNEEDTMDVKAMAKLLGLPEDATEEQVTARVEELKAAEEAANEDPKPDGDPDPDPDDNEDEDDPADDPAPANSRGVLVDKDTLATLRAQAAMGEEARKKQLADERDTFLTNAMDDGKFPPASLGEYKKLWAKDPKGTREFVESLASGTVPTSEMGTTQAQSADASYYPPQWLPEIHNNDGSVVTQEA